MRSRFIKILFIITLGVSALSSNINAISFFGKKAPDNFADIIEPLLPATVNISTTTILKKNKRKDHFQDMPPGMGLDELFRQFLEDMPHRRPQKETSLGSGFIISREGKTAYIVTCNHVIAGHLCFKVI